MNKIDEIVERVCDDSVQSETKGEKRGCILLESELRSLLQEVVEPHRKDAERYREARNNPVGFVHLLSLMLKEQSEGKGNRAKALDDMMDRIIASRKGAVDAAIAAAEGK